MCCGSSNPDGKKLNGDLSQVQQLRLEMGDHPTVIRHLSDAERANPTSGKQQITASRYFWQFVLLDGELGTGQFANERWNDPKVRSLMGLLTAYTDEELRRKAPENFAMSSRSRNAIWRGRHRGARSSRLVS